jgi:hypothetical protein
VPIAGNAAVSIFRSAVALCAWIARSAAHVAVHLVRALNAAGHAHRRGVNEKRNRGVIGADHERRTDRLLAVVVGHDPVLHAPHDRFAEHPHHRGVDAGGHHAERVAGRHEGVVRVQFLEPRPHDANPAQSGESPPECAAHRLVRVNQPDGFEHQ